MRHWARKHTHLMESKYWVHRTHSACAPELCLVLWGNVQHEVVCGAEKHLPSIQRQPMRFMVWSLCRSHCRMTALRTNLLGCFTLMNVRCSVCHSYVYKNVCCSSCIQGSYFMNATQAVFLLCYIPKRARIKYEYKIFNLIILKPHS